MVDIDPQQEIFTALIIELRKLGYGVYDGYLPPDGTTYPFIYIGDSQQIDDANKNAVFGNVFQTIHVWHSDPGRRGTVSSMLLVIKQVCRRIDRTTNFTWDVRNISQRIIPDNTTSTPLLHAILDVEWKFN